MVNGTGSPFRGTLGRAFLLFILILSVCRSTYANEEIDDWVAGLPDPLSLGRQGPSPHISHSKLPFYHEDKCALSVQGQGPIVENGIGIIRSDLLEEIPREGRTTSGILQAISEYCGVEKLTDRLRQTDRFYQSSTNRKHNQANELMCYVERAEYLAAWRVAVWSLTSPRQYPRYPNLEVLSHLRVIPYQGAEKQVLAVLSSWQAEHLPRIAEANSQNCIAYFTQTYLVETIANTRGREATEAEQQRQAQLAQEVRERQRAEDERQRAEQEHAAQLALEAARQDRAQVFAASGVAPEHWILWGSEDNRSPSLQESDEPSLLNKINEAYQARISLTDDDTKFTAPEQGEFEKTEDYDQRVRQLRQEHDVAIAQRQEELTEAQASLFATVWNESLGSPRLEGLRYDADAESFHAQIQSSAGFSIRVSMSVPIGEAEATKPRLEGARPWVLSSLRGDQLTPHVAILQVAGETIEAQLERTSIDFSFNSSQLTVHRDQEAANAQAAADAREARHIARARTHPYVATFDCSVNGSSMPFSACLRTNGSIEVHTAEGAQTYTLLDLVASSSHTVDLTQAFRVSAQVGTGSRFGSIQITIVDRLSGRRVGNTMASGAGDYAIIKN